MGLGVGPGDRIPVGLDADPLVEVRRSRRDPATGRLVCVACGRGYTGTSALAQHLAGKHRGLNRVGAPTLSGAEASAALEALKAPRLGDAPGRAPPQAASLATFFDAALAPTPAQASESVSGSGLGGAGTTKEGKKQGVPASLDNAKAINAARRAAKAKAAKEREGEAPEVQTGVQRSRRKKLSAIKKHVLKERRAMYEARLLEEDAGPPAVALQLTVVRSPPKGPVADDEARGACEAEGEGEGEEEWVKLDLVPTAQHRLPLRAAGAPQAGVTREAAAAVAAAAAAAQDLPGRGAVVEGAGRSGSGSEGGSDSEVDGERERERGMGLIARSAAAAEAMAWHVQAPAEESRGNISGAGGAYASAAELPAGREAQLPRYTGPGVNIRYCDQVITRRLNEAVELMLAKLMYYQERARARDPVKAKARRRVCSGMREVGKLVERGRAKMLVVAPNIEEIAGALGLDSLITRMVTGCRRANVPVVFALSKARLGAAVTARGGSKVSVCAIISYEGAGDEYLAVLSEAQAGYREFLEVRAQGAT